MLKRSLSDAGIAQMEEQHSRKRRLPESPLSVLEEAKALLPPAAPKRRVRFHATTTIHEAATTHSDECSWYTSRELRQMKQAAKRATVRDVCYDALYHAGTLITTHRGCEHWASPALVLARHSTYLAAHTEVLLGNCDNGGCYARASRPAVDYALRMAAADAADAALCL